MTTTSGIREIPYLPRSPEAVVAAIGPLASGGVNIELWDENGNVPSALTSSGCNQLGDTDFFAWPISGLTFMTDTRAYFHWRMTAASGSSSVGEGDIILFSVEGRAGQMPSLTNKSSYIIRN